MPTNLPAADQQIERAGGEREQRSERKQMQQQEEPEKAALAMQVGRRELPDQVPPARRSSPRNGRDSRSAISTSGK